MVTGTWVLRELFRSRNSFNTIRVLSKRVINLTKLVMYWTNKLDVHALFLRFLIRKEVIHPQLRLGIPCYDLVPIAEFGLAPLAGLFGRLQLCWLDGRIEIDKRFFSFPPSERIFRTGRALMMH